MEASRSFRGIQISYNSSFRKHILAGYALHALLMSVNTGQYAAADVMKDSVMYTIHC